MTLQECRDFVLDALKEQVAPAGLVPSTASLDRWINKANMAVYLPAVHWDPTPWAVRSGTITYPAGEYIDLTSMDVGTFSAPLEVVLGDTVKVYLICYVEILMPNGRWLPIEPTNFRDRWQFEGYENRPYGLTDDTFRWYIEGNSFILAPVPAEAKSLRMVYLPELPDLVNNTDLVLGGQVRAAADVVGYKTLQLLWKKDEEKTTPWDTEVEDGMEDIRRALRRSQLHGPRRVRSASRY